MCNHKFYPFFFVGTKRPSPRGGRYDNRDQRGGPPHQQRGGSGGYSSNSSSYRGGGGQGAREGGTGGNNWNRRGGRGGSSGGGGRYYGGQEYWSESDGSDWDEDFNTSQQRRNAKVTRKDSNNSGSGGGNKYGSGAGSGGSQKDGFAPRGEPSRRGRGAGPAPGFRRGAQSNAAAPSTKRIDNYGPPSSKSPFGTSDEQKSTSGGSTSGKIDPQSVDDRTKQKQMALSAGLAGYAKPHAGNKGPQRSNSGHNIKTEHPSDKTAPSTISESEKPVVTDAKKDVKYETSENEKNKKLLSNKKDEHQPLQQRNSSGGSSGQLNSNFNKNKPRDDHYRTNPQQQQQQAAGKPGTQKPAGKPTNVQQQQPTSKPAYNRDRDQRGERDRDRRAGGNTATTTTTVGGAGQQKQMPARVTKQMEPTRSPAPAISSGNAWEKPLNHSQPATTPIAAAVTATTPTATSNSKTDNNNKQLLDGTTPPKNTLIFENTNLKPVPPPVSAQNNLNSQQQQQQQQYSHHHQQPPQSHHLQQQDDVFNKMFDQQRQQVSTSQQHQHQQEQHALTSALGMTTFVKAGAGGTGDSDMNLAFTFESELSQLTDEKNNSGGGNYVSAGAVANNVTAAAVVAGNKTGLCLPKSIHHSVATVAQNSIISPSTADLNMKIASVKKVWEVPVMATVLEQSLVDDGTGQHFVTAAQQHQMHQFAAVHAGQMQHHAMQQHTISPGPPSYSSFGPPDASTLEHFSKVDASDNHEHGGGYSPSAVHQQQQQQHQQQQQSSHLQQQQHHQNMAMKQHAELGGVGVSRTGMLKIFLEKDSFLWTLCRKNKRNRSKFSKKITKRIQKRVLF
jgi:hypothetical protein